MNWLVYHIVSGDSFFTGIGLLVIAAYSSTRPQPICLRIAVLAFLMGTIAIVVSSTAIPYWYDALAIAVTAVWTASGIVKSWRVRTACSVCIVWILAAIIELPYRIAPTLNPAATRKLAVIGDSVTAGVDGDERSETWPHILAREHDLEVQDISHIGETAASAVKRAKTHLINASVVIVEIGGNDLLGSTTSEQFERDLDSLLTHLSGPDRQVVMFELPLPPFHHEYGRVQRSVAAKHHVSMIPKRIFLSVIAGTSSTLDSIHLTQAGHQLMSDYVWNVVQEAFAGR